jgi:hypothetical protein
VLERLRTWCPGLHAAGGRRRHISIDPRHLAISEQHVVAASGEVVYVWQYRAGFSRALATEAAGRKWVAGARLLGRLCWWTVSTTSPLHTHTRLTAHLPRQLPLERSHCWPAPCLLPPPPSLIPQPTQHRRKEGRDRIFHIDDGQPGPNQTPDTWQHSQRRTEDPITAITASAEALLVSGRRRSTRACPASQSRR